jgi:hypothetical protein
MRAQRNRSDDVEAMWAENVQKAKTMVSVRKQNQMEIAGLALEVCEITRGGPAVIGRYTLKRFAEEIGMNSRVLSGWVSVRVKVYSKLPSEKRTGCTFTQLAHVALRVAPDSTQGFVLKRFAEICEKDPFEAKLCRRLPAIRAAAQNFAKEGAAGRLPVEMLQEFLFYCGNIAEQIRKHYPNISGADHGIAATTNFRSLTAADALKLPSRKVAGYTEVDDPDGFGKVKLTEKDKTVAHFLRRGKKFFGPAEVGIRVGKRSPTAATAWALRTLQKLVGLNLVERNKHGQYRWADEARAPQKAA